MYRFEDYERYSSSSESGSESDQYSDQEGCHRSGGPQFSEPSIPGVNPITGWAPPDQDQRRVQVQNIPWAIYLDPEVIPDTTDAEMQQILLEHPPDQTLIVATPPDEEEFNPNPLVAADEEEFLFPGDGSEVIVDDENLVNDLRVDNAGDDIGWFGEEEDDGWAMRLLNLGFTIGIRIGDFIDSLNFWEHEHQD